LSVDGVIPIAVEIVADERYGSQFAVADPDSGGIPVRVVVGFDGESGGGCGARNEFDDGAQTGEGLM
jgi:hypothetical protein